ncbi:MAG TPA: DeoR/GlpR family DNA-binding transcription regulator [Oscillospiraceae bacterium]|nr:DeoR/GlpR family DNA-binding transcription regulator [Oscillospiraceae bacterium]HPK35948.1 DeoR/GlpR family DNA-binding transcription regulator [Oscillospiraceae bacterium]HPR75641.1 DeoR/GlpR family DNA-binding transcription regulator [Oscillospiraceae bacterium]
MVFMEERQREIAEQIRINGKITINEIVEKYNISGESARRDLRLLDENGLCKRTRGGAITPVQTRMMPPCDRNYDAMPVWDNYDAIAKKAAQEVHENDVVYLTGGSLGFLMLRHLPRDFKYTLVVNSVDLANRLREWENVEVWLAGGKMRRSASMVDSMATEFIKKLHFDICFITGAGVTAQFGLSNGTDETATFQRAVVANSRKKILLMPGQKVGSNAFIQVCPAEKFDTLITDWEGVEDELAKIAETGVEVIAVEKPAE